jgi:Tol biopolymer transport system component
VGSPVVIDDGPGGITDVAWAPDSQSLIYPKAGRLKQLRLDPHLRPGPAELLPFGEGASTLSLASAGPLVYSVELSDTNLYSLDLSRPGSVIEPAAVPASTHDDYTPAYSPDGRRVAFTSTRSGSEELWLSNADGTGLRQITFMGGPSCADPQWSPDNRTLLFHSAAGGSADIYRLSSDSLDIQRLTTETSDEVEPKWSRDGRWIYFGSNRTGRFEVWKMRAEGGPAVQITHGGGLDAQESPDGRFLYYAKPEAPTSIWKMPVRGGQSMPVVDQVSYPLNFIVSDNGIYFVAVGTAVSDTSIDFFDFESNTRMRRAILGKPWSYGVGLSPDGRSLLVPRVDREVQDLMMVNRTR